MGLDSNVIRLSGVCFSYRTGIPVLDGLDFELGRREKTGLIGANGSGKTTLLHLIVGLLRPDAGEIEIFGKPRRSEDDFREVRARVGLLFQDAEDQLFSPTVAEDVAFGPLNLGKKAGEAVAIVRETLCAVGLDGYESRISYRLSAGEKRLASLAGVLAMRPDVLLLDEPSGGLDDDSRERVIEILSELPQAMVVISHDRDFLGRITTSTLRLERGKLVSDGVSGN